MTDNFVLLGEPRQPWVEVEEIKEHFLKRSAEAHPDRFHNASEVERTAANQRFADLNTAFNCLRDPKSRLLHLLELETGQHPSDVQRIPPGTMDLFMEVGQLCRDADTFLSEKAAATSPMLKVRVFKQGLEWTAKLQVLLDKVNARRDELATELKRMNTVWRSAPSVDSPDRAVALPLERLEQIHRILSYVGRWSEQIRERQVRLTL